MWCLARQWGIGPVGALAAALTFMWSGFIIGNGDQPWLFAALTWAPLTILLVDRAIQRSALAAVGLAIAVGLQLLLGATEIFVHIMFVCGLLAGCRLVALVGRGEWRAAGAGVLCVSVALAAGIGLAAVQLLPSIELMRMSTRAAGALRFDQATFMGVIVPSDFLRGALTNTGWMAAGVLPLVGGPLALSSRRQRAVVVAAAVTAVLAALLAFGGAVFQFYFRWIPTGTWFRRPAKFIDVYCVAQAILAGVALGRLEEWTATRRVRVWIDEALAAAVLLGACVAAWLWMHRERNPLLWVCLALLVLFAVIPRRGWRTAIVVALCVLQGGSLFFTVGNSDMRVAKRPRSFDEYRWLLHLLQPRLGNDRLYLAPNFFRPSLIVKQGVLSRIHVSTDYETLAVGRYGQFFDYSVGPRSPYLPFDGQYAVGAQTRWRMLDITATRLFIVPRGDASARFMSASASGPPAFRVVWSDRVVQVFQRSNALPRAHVVGRARAVTGGDDALATLDRADFDARTEVVLERNESEPVPESSEGFTGGATITVDEPERVEVAVTANAPGYLVLADLFYPGWQAFVDGRDAAIERANFLFRAVRVPTGTSMVVFEYRPLSFRLGVLVSSVTAVLIAAAVVIVVRRRDSARRAKRL